ncbi:hypothetical protein KPL74_04645 [Bacillus sp. NP157]|nr:hypothetical protein KPL74_04645 [Bacillus sp. NP157]
MVTITVRCKDQSASDCLKTVDVETGVPELNEAQLAGIFNAGGTRPPLKAGAIHGVATDTTYFVPVSLDDAVCTACSRDRASEIPEFRADDELG